MDIQSKIVAAALAFIVILAANSAMATEVVSYTGMYETVEELGERKVCTRGDDKTTEGAIVGGVIGAQEGDAFLGALVGGLIGNIVGEEKCTTETYVVRTYERLVGWNVVLVSPDGTKHYVFLPKN